MYQLFGRRWVCAAAAVGMSGRYIGVSFCRILARVFASEVLVLGRFVSVLNGIVLELGSIVFSFITSWCTKI